MKKLGIYEAGNANSCFIETFTELGWKDPFPSKHGEDFIMTIRPVVAFALPSKRLMLNIMRACIGITDPSKLWIN